MEGGREGEREGGREGERYISLLRVFPFPVSLGSLHFRASGTRVPSGFYQLIRLHTVGVLCVLSES